MRKGKDMGRKCPKCAAQVMTLGEFMQKGPSAGYPCSGCGATLQLHDLAVLLNVVVALLGVGLGFWYLQGRPASPLTVGLVYGGAFLCFGLLGRVLAYLLVPWKTERKEA
jgi:hypothetical protein